MVDVKHWRDGFLVSSLSYLWVSMNTVTDDAVYMCHFPSTLVHIRLCVCARVHKNKSMQHHTLGSGTAEFQVTWPPKLREGTYLVKNVRARFEYRKTIAAHEKQVIMQEKTQPCASLWRKTLRPKRVRFLAIDAPIVDYVCLPLYHLTFFGSYQPLCEFSWRKKKEKARKKGSGFTDKILTWVSGLPRSATTPIHHFVQYAKVTLLEISPCQGPTVKRSGVAYSCSYALLVCENTGSELVYGIFRKSNACTNSVTRGQSLLSVAPCTVKHRSGTTSPLFTKSFLWNFLPSSLRYPDLSAIVIFTRHIPWDSWQKKPS